MKKVEGHNGAVGINGNVHPTYRMTSREVFELVKAAVAEGKTVDVSKLTFAVYNGHGRHLDRMMSAEYMLSVDWTF